MKGKEWFERRFLPAFHPVTVVALLATLVLIFAFQADNLTARFVHVVLIAIPLLLQVYFNSGLAYGLMKWLKVPHDVAAPGALIGASNFFELAVATAIALFGPESGAALATVVGVLVEVPVMLSVCSFCNRTRHWFPTPTTPGPPPAVPPSPLPRPEAAREVGADAQRRPPSPLPSPFLRRTAVRWGLGLRARGRLERAMRKVDRSRMPMEARGSRSEPPTKVL